MKQHFSRTRGMLLALALLGIMVTLSVPSFAQENKQQVVASADAKATIQYLGTSSEGSTFRLGFNNEMAVKFLLSVTSADGEVFFTQDFETDNFSRLIKLKSEITDKVPQLLFTIRVLPNGEAYTFDVNSNTKSVNTVVLSK